MPTHYQGNPTTTTALDTFIKLTRATNALEHKLSTVQAGEGLTSSQFGVLETLFHLGPLCQGSLSGKLLKSTGNITLVLDNLEKQGLVRRIRMENDRRMIMIHLTDQGRQCIEEIFPRIAEAITGSFNGLSPQEQIDLGRLCKKLGSSLENK
jgi:MarR family transcriptional regulator, 2-MHQ and catechol-resistance regulon repressor